MFEEIKNLIFEIKNFSPYYIMHTNYGQANFSEVLASCKLSLKALSNWTWLWTPTLQNWLRQVYQTVIRF